MENIGVVLRVRPMNNSQRQNKDIDIWTVIPEDDMITITPDQINDLIRLRQIAPGQQTQYMFNKCFDKISTNIDLYENLVKRIALSSLQGINGTVFLYGQTGSGKTFSMMGANHHTTSSSISSSMIDLQHNLYSAFPKEIMALSENQLFQRMSRKCSQNLYNNENMYSISSSSNAISGRIVSTSVNNSISKSRLLANRANGHISKSPPGMREITTPSRKDICGLKIGELSNGNFSPDQKGCLKLGAEKNCEQNMNLIPNSTKNLGLNLNSINFAVGNPLREYMEGHNGGGCGGGLFDSEVDSGNCDGVLMLALRDIFQEMEKQKDKQFLIRASYVEIYNDNVYDLLKSQENLNQTCTINEDNNQEFYIQGAIQEIIQSVEQVLHIIKKGEYNRHYASTAMNHVSSRSHAIFRLYVRSMAKNYVNTHQVITDAILNFVDLAGSQKIDIHNSLRKRCNSGGGSMGITSTNLNKIISDRQTQSKTINKSLFFLTQVISLKSEGKQDIHIPYRNSPLTKILRSSLGGNSRTAIILCINPCVSQLEQTISTIRFGLHAKQIENNIHKNVIFDNNNAALQTIIKQYQKRIYDLEHERDQTNEQQVELRRHIATLNEQKYAIETRVSLKQLNNLLIVQNSENLQKEIQNCGQFQIEGQETMNQLAGIIFWSIKENQKNGISIDKDNSNLKDDIQKKLVKSVQKMREKCTSLETKSGLLKKLLQEAQKLRCDQSQKHQLLAEKHLNESDILISLFEIQLNQKNKYQQISEIITSNQTTLFSQMSSLALSALQAKLLLLLNEVKTQSTVNMVFLQLNQIIFNAKNANSETQSNMNCPIKEYTSATANIDSQQFLLQFKENLLSNQQSLPIIEFQDQIFQKPIFPIEFTQIKENFEIEKQAKSMQLPSFESKISIPSSLKSSLKNSPLKQKNHQSISTQQAQNHNIINSPYIKSTNIINSSTNSSSSKFSVQSVPNSTQNLNTQNQKSNQSDKNSFNFTNYVKETKGLSISSNNNNNKNNSIFTTTSNNHNNTISTVNHHQSTISLIVPPSTSTLYYTEDNNYTIQPNFCSFQNYFNAIKKNSATDSMHVGKISNKKNNNDKEMKLENSQTKFNFLVQNNREQTQSQYRELLMTQNSACTHNFQEPLRYLDSLEGRDNRQQMQATTSTMNSMEFQDGFFTNSLNSVCKDLEKNICLQELNSLESNNNFGNAEVEEGSNDLGMNYRDLNIDVINKQLNYNNNGILIRNYNNNNDKNDCKNKVYSKVDFNKNQNGNATTSALNSLQNGNQFVNKENVHYYNQGNSGNTSSSGSIGVYKLNTTISEVGGNGSSINNKTKI